VYLDGIVLKRSWAGEIKNVSVLVAIGVEVSSNLVFSGLNQAAAWSTSVTSMPSLNLTPVITFAR
jgi:putative transposase